MAIADLGRKMMDVGTQRMSPINNEDLDDTRSMRRRWDDTQPPPPRPGPHISYAAIAVTVALFMIGHLVTSIWWAATQDANMKFMQLDYVKLWDLYQDQKKEIDSMQRKISEMEYEIRQRGKEGR